jgi:hypothetical protein
MPKQNEPSMLSTTIPRPTAALGLDEPGNQELCFAARHSSTIPQYNEAPCSTFESLSITSSQFRESGSADNKLNTAHFHARASSTTFLPALTMTSYDRISDRQIAFLDLNGTSVNITEIVLAGDGI